MKGGQRRGRGRPRSGLWQTRQKSRRMPLEKLLASVLKDFLLSYDKQRVHDIQPSRGLNNYLCVYNIAINAFLSY